MTSAHAALWRKYRRSALEQVAKYSTLAATARKLRPRSDGQTSQAGDDPTAIMFDAEAAAHARVAQQYEADLLAVGEPLE